MFQLFLFLYLAFLCLIIVWMCMLHVHNSHWLVLIYPLHMWKCVRFGSYVVSEVVEFYSYTVNVVQFLTNTIPIPTFNIFKINKPSHAINNIFLWRTHCLPWNCQHKVIYRQMLHFISILFIVHLSSNGRQIIFFILNFINTLIIKNTKHAPTSCWSKGYHGEWNDLFSKSNTKPTPINQCPLP